MRRLQLTTVLLCILGMHLPQPCGAASKLIRLGQYQRGSTVQIFAYFDQVPDTSQNLSDKRLDITLRDTAVSDQLTPLPNGTAIVKNLVLPSGENTLLSFFLRYPPQDVKLSETEANTLVIELIAGNRFTSAYQEVAAQLGPATLVERPSSGPADPLALSRYADDWRTFFSDYQTAAVIDAPVMTYIPPFPLIEIILPEDEEAIPVIGRDIVPLVLNNNWFEALNAIQQSLKQQTDPEALKQLAFTHAELLFRLGNHQAAGTQLDQLMKTYQREPLGMLAHYLNALLLARSGDSINAAVELEALLGRLEGPSTLLSAARVLLAETNLVTGNYQEMERNLNKASEDAPAQISNRILLRRADLLFARGNIIQSYQDYEQFISAMGPDALHDTPYSLNGYCQALYSGKQFEQSASCYEHLATILTDNDNIGKALYLKALSDLQAGENPNTIVDQLQRIETTFPDTEASLRSILKRGDICYLQDRQCAAEAMNTYKTVAGQSRYRRLAEEAQFKLALLKQLEGDTGGSIAQLMTLLKNDQSGPLRTNAEALLIQLLPEEITRLLEQGAYLEAIALAQQNRRLFENNWLDLSLLAELGLAYENLGLYREAQSIFSYLLNTAGADTQENHYLPLIRIAHAAGDQATVENVSSQYFYNYPDGIFHDSILYFRLDSLYASGYIDQAENQLPDQPPDDRFRFLAASIYFQQRNYQAALDNLQPFREKPRALPDEQIFILAECLFQLDSTFEAETLFSLTSDLTEFKVNSQYRLAQIALEKGQTAMAQEYLEKIAESDDNRGWQKFARQKIALQQILEN